MSEYKEFQPETNADNIDVFGDSFNTLKSGGIFRVTSDKDITNMARGVIAPSHDYRVNPLDLSFASTCRQYVSDDREGAYPKLTPFMVAVAIYTFVGGHSHMLARSHRSKSLWRPGGGPAPIADTMDAFQDVLQYIKDQFKGDERDYYLKDDFTSTDNEDRAKLPLLKAGYVLNTLAWDSKNKEPRPAVRYVGRMAGEYIKAQLRWQALRSDTAPALDPKFPDYKLGDVTDPTRALEFGFAKRQLMPNSNKPATALTFTQEDNILDPNMRTRVISPEQLAKRELLCLDSTWNFPTYQEQVDMLVEHYRLLPVEFIKYACGHNANVGERRATPIVSDGGRGAEQSKAPTRTIPGFEEEDALDMTPVSVPTGSAPPPLPPTAPAPPAAPPSAPPVAPPVAAPPVAEPKFWVAEPGQGAVEKSISAIAASLTPTLMLMKDGAWVAASTVVPAPAPAPVAPPAPPVAPTAPVAPAAPAAVVAPVAAPVTTPAGAAPQVDDTVVRNYLSNFDNLSEEGKTAVRTAVAAIEASKASGSPVPPELVDVIYKHMAL